MFLLQTEIQTQSERSLLINVNKSNKRYFENWDFTKKTCKTFETIYYPHSHPVSRNPFIPCSPSMDQRKCGGYEILLKVVSRDAAKLHTGSTPAMKAPVSVLIFLSAQHSGIPFYFPTQSLPSLNFK